ncbi:MAG: thiolase family protein [Desulfarculaceae bacterium]|nr:thiolase family protein [Desulfarculaceae bacterium]MCF8073893.1 thiolase family protein [Desulfarculaceae bacterium]MCF8102873.1 thiolase family protein [Desulfarculaceae bacterium]MCF8116317.1 thiolase family protein [Desulfarculaceae bacterium]
MFKNVYIPHKGYWSSPFSRWQMSFQNEHPIKLAASTAKKCLELRQIDPAELDGCTFGMTIGMPSWFYANPWFCALMGNDKISGPTVSQACATSATSLYTAAAGVECGAYQCNLVATTDRCSNGPHSVWPNPKGPGGEVISENWMMDNFNNDPYGGKPMFVTAELVGQDNGGVAKEESDELALKRYQQYEMSLADDRAFQKGYMIPVDIKISKKKTLTVDADEGIMPTTADGLASLKPILPDGALTFGAQTHPADGNAGLIVTTEEKAKELSADKSVTIQVMSYGHARAAKARMAAAVTPSAEMALKNAGITVGDLAAVKTHNPFTINDIIMGRLMNIPPDIFNNYGSSLIFGHPQGPTGARCIVELIEELVLKGGGYGLFAGCAAGDTAAAIVVKVS